MERFSNILYAFVRLQDSWRANHTTGLPRSFSFSRMIMPMSVIAFDRCARRHPVASVFIIYTKKDVGVSTSRLSRLQAFALPHFKISNAVSPRRDILSFTAAMTGANIIHPTQTLRCRLFRSEFKFAKFEAER